MPAQHLADKGLYELLRNTLLSCPARLLIAAVYGSTQRAEGAATTCFTADEEENTGLLFRQMYSVEALLTMNVDHSALCAVNRSSDSGAWLWGA